LLRYIEIDAELHKVLAVLKMRRSAHAHDLRTYEITPEGIVVGAPLRNYRGILTGAPQHNGGPQPSKRGKPRPV